MTKNINKKTVYDRDILYTIITTVIRGKWMFCILTANLIKKIMAWNIHKIECYEVHRQQQRKDDDSSVIQLMNLAAENETQF